MGLLGFTAPAEPLMERQAAVTDSGVAALDSARLQEKSKGSELFQRQCVVCHGKKGKGDGPAAVALTPHPANLTDAKLMSKVTDEDLKNIIANGKGPMPAFSKLFTSQQLDALVVYVRSLSAGKEVKKKKK